MTHTHTHTHTHNVPYGLRCVWQRHECRLDDLGVVFLAADVIIEQTCVNISHDKEEMMNYKLTCCCCRSFCSLALRAPPICVWCKKCNERY
jgi:hypothetical protein